MAKRICNAVKWKARPSKIKTIHVQDFWALLMFMNTLLLLSTQLWVCVCCVCLRVCLDKRQREAIHTHAPGPCHVHVTVSWKDKRNHHQPSKRKFDSVTRGASRQTVLNLTGMRECREEEEGRKRGGGDPSAIPGLWGSDWRQEFTRQKQLYIAGHGGEVCWYSGLVFFFFF